MRTTNRQQVIDGLLNEIRTELEAQHKWENVPTATLDTIMEAEKHGRRAAFFLNRLHSYRLVPTSNINVETKTVRPRIVTG